MMSVALRVSGLALILATTVFSVPAQAGPIRTEALLLGTEAAPDASGKAKHEIHNDRTKFHVDADDIPAAYNDQTVSIRVNGEEVGTAVVKKGKVRLKLDSKKGETVPNINPGDFVSITIGGGEVDTVLLEGQFPGGGGETHSPF